MALRVCLVTPFAWSQPHDVNEHVAGAAAELRRLGHSVTVLAPSTRTADLRAGRRALLHGTEAEVIAVGPALRVSRRSRIGVPVGVRANLRLALESGGYDVVHGFEPGLPSLSYLALTFSHALSVATFFSVERLNYPHGRGRRDRLLARVDALLATSPEVAEAAAIRFPGDYSLVTPGVDPVLFRPAEKRKLIVLEWRPIERPLARSVLRVLRELPDWELVLLRTKTLTARPTVPRALRERVHVRTARSGTGRAALLAEASIYVPAIDGLARARLEAAAAGAALVEPPGLRDQPELAGAAVARLAEQEDVARAQVRRGPRVGCPAELRGARGRSWTSSTGSSSPAAGPVLRAGSRWRTATGSSPTCTSTPRGRTTAGSTSPIWSSTPSPRTWARSRSPTTTSSAARSRPSSWHVGAASSSSPARRSRPTARAR